MRVVRGLLVVVVLCTGFGCGAKEEAPPPSDVDAQSILTAMQRALGGPEAVERIAVVDALAECEGPSGPFETRLRRPALLGERVFDGQAVWTIQFLDELDGEVELYVAVDDALPLGMKSINHSGQGEREIFIRVDDWRVIDGVHLFTKAVFTQGKDDYAYDYVEVAVNPDADRLSGEDALKRDAS